MIHIAFGRAIYTWRQTKKFSRPPVKKDAGTPANNAYKVFRQKYQEHRAAAMSALYKQGKTLQEIGDKYSLTRERVRQILKGSGVMSDEGGQTIKLFAKIRYQKKKRDQWAKAFGCPYQEALEINGGVRLRVKGTPASAYIQQRHNAKNRGILWEMTFPEWWRIWVESGQWENRGCGKLKYVMTRCCDTGPYSTENVEIKTVQENGREYQLMRQILKEQDK